LNYVKNKIKEKHIADKREPLFISANRVRRGGMGLTNFVLTVAGVSAVVLLLRSDVKQSASIFKRNVKQIRHWLEEETSNSSK
jgi:hypothetical protein